MRQTFGAFDLKQFFSPSPALRRHAHDIVIGALGFGFLLFAVASIQFSEHVAPAMERFAENWSSNAVWNARRGGPIG
jgi:hypothetical protein